MNGEVFVAVNLATLGLKSKVSDALIPDGKVGISLLNASAGYESTVKTSPVSLPVSYTHLTLPTKA